MNIITRTFIKKISTQQQFPLPSKILLIRHAQSIFNAKCQQYRETQVYGKDAQNKFHHDPNIIDCSITESAMRDNSSDKLVPIFADININNTLLCVSPMLRTLQTTNIILSTTAKNYRVLAMPNLTQIISKICDFSSGIQNKKYQFPTFSFLHVDQWMDEQRLNQKLENWQDPYIEQTLRGKIDRQGKAGKRYLELLKLVFPKPLEKQEKCRERSVTVFRKMCQICQQENYQNLVVISHNRILKYIEMEIIKNEAKDFQNFEIRMFQHNSTKQ